MITAKDILSKPALINPKTPISTIIQLLGEKGNSCAVVVNSKNSVLGIITRTDIINKVLLQNKKKLSIKNLMTSKVVSAYPDDDILLLEQLMRKHGVKHIPIIGKSNFIGLVRLEDIAKKVHEIESNNKKFILYQNAQTIIIIGFLIFLILFLFLKISGA